jgi:hypothetical protein
MAQVVLCATVGSRVIVAWSDEQPKLQDAINELKTDKVEYTVLDNLVDCKSSTILKKLELLNWARDGRARMETLLGKLQEDGNWEERFILLQAVEGNKVGTIFKDIEVRLSSSASPRTALPRLASHRLEPPHIDVARTCAGGARCQHGLGATAGSSEGESAHNSSAGSHRHTLAAVCACVCVCVCVCVFTQEAPSGGGNKRRKQSQSESGAGPSTNKVCVHTPLQQ